MQRRNILVIAVTAFVIAAGAGFAVSAPSVLAGDKAKTDSGDGKSSGDSHSMADEDNDLIDIDGDNNNVSIIAPGATPGDFGGDADESQDNDYIDVDGDGNTVNVEIGDSPDNQDGSDGMDGDGDSDGDGSLADTTLTAGDIATLIAGLNDAEVEALADAIDSGEITEDDLEILVELRSNGTVGADELGEALRADDIEQAIDDLIASSGDGDGDGGDDMNGDANVTIENCTDALVDTNLSNASVEIDVLNLVTGDTDTVTASLDGTTTVSLDEDQSLLSNQTDVNLDAATITEVRVLDEDGDVVAVDSNDDIAACVEVLGLEVAEVDTELALQLDLLTDGFNDGNLTVNDIAQLTVGLNDTEIEALNEAIDTGEISQDELVDIARLRENGSLSADEFGSALLSGDVGQAIDDLLTSLLPTP